jgi:DNA processing protein
MAKGNARHIDEAERIDRIRLIRSENVGPITFRALLDRFGSAGEALAALPDLARRGGKRGTIRICPRADAERELAAAEAIGARLVVHGTAEFPEMLAVLEDSPPVLTVLGHVHLLARRSVAVVGARNASANARGFTRRLARSLGEAGYLVVSGLARGIDAGAHEGALETGTVAVVAGGVDIVYPPENEALRDCVASAGAIVAEAPVGTTPLARHFPSRNRVIAGLSIGVVVVEAARRSGSLITASCAAGYGREVFAVPGSPLDPRCHGTNALIRDGAHLVESAEDVVAVLDARRMEEPVMSRYRTPSEVVEDASELLDARRTVLGLLGPSPVSVDEIIRECHFSPAVVLTVLLEAELAGLVERHPGNQAGLKVDGEATVFPAP